MGVDLLAETLLPTVEELASDRNWRVRLAVIHHVPMLASQLGRDAFQDRLAPQCMKWLQVMQGCCVVRGVFTVEFH